jgi:crotonobetainyl-CoA:carnitine CoA-transferase CaiB-like acyl-CoA transferase
MGAIADTSRPTKKTPYSGLRVLEFANSPAGELTGLQFVHLGAEVLKLEPQGGAPSRHTGPFAGDQPDIERSLSYWYYNSGKRSIVLASGEDPEQQSLAEMLDEIDVVILEGHPDELRGHDLDPAKLADAHQALVVLAITPFGLSGPWADYKSSDLISLAASGLLILSGYDDHAIPPIRPSGNQGLHTAASFAHQSALLALIERQQSGRGALLDVSIQEAAAVTVEGASLYWFYPRVQVQRQTCRHAQPRPTQPAVFECADGGSVYIVLTIAEEKTWRSLLGWMESHDLSAGLNDPAYSDTKYRQSHFHHIQGIVEAFFLLLDAKKAFHEGQMWGLPVGIMNAPEDLFDDEHLEAREVFRSVEQPGGGAILQPATPYRFSNFETIDPLPAQRLGSEVVRP